MKNLFVIGAFALAAACATTEDADVVAVDTGPAAGSWEALELSGDHRVYFEYDQYDLSPQAQASLDAQVAWLAANPGSSIRVEGNCDERGTREYNLALGARRSNAAKSYLEAMGVASDRIEATSNGKERPLNVLSNEEAWAENRNAWTYVVGPAS